MSTLGPQSLELMIQNLSSIKWNLSQIWPLAKPVAVAEGYWALPIKLPAGYSLANDSPIHAIASTGQHRCLYKSVIRPVFVLVPMYGNIVSHEPSSYSILIFKVTGGLFKIDPSDEYWFNWEISYDPESADGERTTPVHTVTLENRTRFMQIRYNNYLTVNACAEPIT